jgi:hypothetical protein
MACIPQKRLFITQRKIKLRIALINEITIPEFVKVVIRSLFIGAFAFSLFIGASFEAGENNFTCCNRE